MRLPRDLPQWLSAGLIAFYVFDVPRLVIEIWRLPLPLLGGRPPYLAPLAAALVAGLLLIARRRGAPLLHAADPVFASALLVCATVALFHGADGGLGLVLDLALFYTGFVAVRAHRDAFGETATVANATLLVALAVTGVHLALLGLAHAGLPPLAADPSEVLQRNGMSFLVVLVCFLAYFRPPASLGPGPLVPLAATAFAIVQILLNESRGALVALVALATARFVLRAHRSSAGAGLALLGALTLCAFVAMGDAALRLTEPLLGAADHRVSAVSRLSTNGALLDAFLAAPLLGIGAASVDAVRSAGYSSHTLPLIVLAAFGLAGFLPIVAATWFMARADEAAASATRVALTLLLLVTVFVNDAWPWLALAIGLVALDAAPAVARARRSRRDDIGHTGESLA